MGGWHRIGLDDTFQIRQAISVGLAQAVFCSCTRCTHLFTEKKVYYSTYSVFTSILNLSSGQGKGERMDGVGWLWMMFPFGPLSHLI